MAWRRPIRKKTGIFQRFPRRGGQSMDVRTEPLRRHASQPAPAGRHPSLDGSNATMLMIDFIPFPCSANLRLIRSLLALWRPLDSDPWDDSGPPLPSRHPRSNTGPDVSDEILKAQTGKRSRKKRLFFPDFRMGETDENGAPAGPRG